MAANTTEATVAGPSKSTAPTTGGQDTTVAGGVNPTMGSAANPPAPITGGQATTAESEDEDDEVGEGKVEWTETTERWFLINMVLEILQERPVTEPEWMRIAARVGTLAGKKKLYKAKWRALQYVLAQ